MFANGIWGRVSSLSTPWRKKEAAVVCRQLGFKAVITALRYSAFGKGSGPIVMSEVQCVGTEKTLQQCQYRDMVNSNLGVRYGVGVVCQTHYFFSGDSGEYFTIENVILFGKHFEKISNRRRRFKVILHKICFSAYSETEQKYL